MTIQSTLRQARQIKIKQLIQKGKWIGIILASLSALSSSIFIFPFAMLSQESSPRAAGYGLLISAFVFSSLVSVSSIRLNSFAQIKPYHLLILVLIALCTLGGNFSIAVALQHITPALAQSLQRTEVLFVTFLGLLLLGQILTYRLFLGGLFVLLGVILIYSFSFQTMNVENYSILLLPLLSAFFFATMSVLTQLLKQLNAYLINSIRLFIVVSSIFLMPDILQEVLGFSFKQWFFALASGLFGPFLSRIAYTRAARLIPIAQVSTITTAAPMLVLVWQFIFFRIPIAWIQLVGILFILGGTIYMLQETSRVKTKTKKHLKNLTQFFSGKKNPFTLFSKALKPQSILKERTSEQKIIHSKRSDQK